MRFGEIFRYELEHRLRSATTWMYAAFLFGLAFFIMNVRAAETEAVLRNAPVILFATGVLFCGTFGILVTAGLFADAAIRDFADGMDPLLFTTRLARTEYLGGRFLAALVVNAILVLAIPAGLALATAMPYLSREAFGPNRLAAYVQPLVLFLWPNLVLVGAILFTIAALTRQAIPVYLGAIGIFIGYIVAANYWSGIESPTLSALADPLGVNALQSMTRYWTVAEQDTRLIGFPTMLVWNRVLWLAIAATVLAILHGRFRFAHADGAGRRRWWGRRVPVDARVDAPTEARWQGTVPRVAGDFRRRTRARQTIAVARQALAEVTSGRAFQVLLVGSVGMVLLWGWNAGDTAFDTPVWPVTHLVLKEVLSQRSILIPWLVIALFAGELVWKHREVGSAEIVDAAPVPTGIALLGRFVALVAIIVAFHAAFMGGGILLQVLQGYHHFEPGLYARVLFGLNLADDVLLAALAMTIHILVNQKYVGHILVLMASVFRMVGTGLGLHRMLVYNSDPGWKYSDMNGFGPYVEPFVWFKLYWAAWALLLAVIAVLFWVRGPELGLRHRLALAGARFRGRTARSAGLAVALIVALGGFVLYNTSVLNHEPSSERDAWRPQAEYEQLYARFERSPQPTLVTADLRVELYPDERAADLRGTYQLVNRTGTAIDSVHVTVPSGSETRSLSLDRAARPVLADEETGYRIFALAQALEPGDTVRLSFDLALRPRGFRTSGNRTAVVRNGTYIDRRLLPFIGYQPAFELSDRKARETFGLASRPGMPSADDADARRHDEVLRNEDRVRIEAIVGTAADQVPVVTGVLRRAWTEKGRRYVHYGTDEAVPFGTAVFSARYAVREDSWTSTAPGAQREVALQVLHHPAHGQNVDRMIAGMKGALDYYTREFGPYQYRELRIVEIPPYSINGRAMVRTIAFAEQNFITRNQPGQVDHTFFGTAHEVAHSWWGGQLRGANVRGRAILSEALSNYSAMMVTEKLLGPEQARIVYDYQMNRYLQRRAEFERDVPLVDVENQPHVAYGKGAVAMYMLREQVGDGPINGALRHLLEKYRSGAPPYATAHDLVAELRTVTPDSLQYLVTDLFETITLWDVRTERAVVEPAGQQGYRVTLDVVARKARADTVGMETDIPMNDFVEVGVFARGSDGGRGEPLYLKPHRIRSGRQTITVTVPREPARAGIDPLRKLIERERADNVAEVKAAEAPRAGAGS